MQTQFRLTLAALALLLAFGSGTLLAQQKPEKAAKKETSKPISQEAKRGKYLVQIAGCNDCHTPAYGMAGGKVDERNWLIGDSLGFRGPWGTTYPANLRLAAQGMNEAQWMARARSRQLRPPMPWFNLRDMTDGDVKAIYAYLKHLGPAGITAPSYLSPDKSPTLPFIQFPSPPPAPATKSK